MHQPKPRKPKGDIKPTILAIGGRTTNGKSFLSEILHNDNTTYISLDEFTCNETNLSTDIMHTAHVLDSNPDICREFISLLLTSCLNFTNSKFIIIDGIYFNRDVFVREFNNQFKHKFKLWMVRPI